MRLIVRLAVAGALYSAGVSGWLLLPGDRAVPMLVWLVAFLGSFPMWGLALFVARRYWRAGVTAGSTLTRPGVVVVGVLVALAALVVTALVLTVVAPLPEVLPGQPEIVDGRYVLNNHGAMTPVSRQEYVDALEAGQRGFVGVALLFYMVAALIVGMTGERLAARGRLDGVHPTQ